MKFRFAFQNFGIQLRLKTETRTLLADFWRFSIRLEELLIQTDGKLKLGRAKMATFCGRRLSDGLSRPS